MHCKVSAATAESFDKELLEIISVKFIRHEFETLSIPETFYDKNFSSAHVTFGREVVDIATDGG